MRVGVVMVYLTITDAGIACKRLVTELRTEGVPGAGL